MDKLLEFVSCCNSTTVIVVIVALGAFVEIVPIKLNPLSSIIKWVGGCLNSETKKQLSSISEKLEDLSCRIDKIEINDMRSTILDFANSCMNERKHTKEEFEHVIDLKNNYDEIIETKGLKNGRVDLAFKFISDLYIKCLNENTFLDD